MSIPKMGEFSGLLNLNKRQGMTSRDVVDLVSRPLKKVKVGHAGTLDPLATGVLVVCVGQATRLIEYVQRMPKAYRTVVRLGARSDTLDADGRIEVEEAPRVPTEPEILEALAAQVGTIEQIPPQFSALKVGGKRAYDLARGGQSVDLAARPVQIDRVELLSYAWPRLELHVDCGSGTYIRSIARDVGEALGCGGLVEVLVRTRIGSFRLEDAIDPTNRSIHEILTHLRPTAEALGDLPRLRISSGQVGSITQGKSLLAADVEGAPGLAGEVGLVGPNGDLVAVAEIAVFMEGAVGVINPRRVLVAGKGA